MFYGFSSLSSLTDISKWNTNNVEDINHMFGGCSSSLSYLSDISNWNSSNATNLSFMFSGCESLSSIPDIEKEILIMLLICIISFMDIHNYHIYLIFQNGILIMLLICLIHLMDANII